MLSKLRIGPKLLLAPGVVLILLLVLSIGAYAGLLRQHQRLEEMVQLRAVRLKAADDLVISAHKAHAEAYQLLTWINASFSTARVDGLLREMHARHAALDSQFARLEMSTQNQPAEQRYVAQSQAAYGLYVKAVADVIELSMADHSMAANAMSKAERSFDVVAQRLDELARLEQSLSVNAYAVAESEFATLKTTMPLLVLVSIALSLLVSLQVRRALLRELHDIGSTASNLAQGNLTVQQRSYGSDEIAETARTLDGSIRNLNATLRNILSSAQTIGSASRMIAAGTADLHINGLDNATQQKLALVEQAAMAASSLQQQAVDLSEAVAKFKLDDYSPPEPSGPAEPAGVLKPGSRKHLSAVRN
ncbi:MCP four helix bundle domain-containing protein [Pseudoduganella danionis]|uniref:MCP four helix bundle domain-containing protein n=1 Tax=Pseudoduganella danionis TaxID=1890295 RepID=UPI0035B049CF